MGALTFAAGLLTISAVEEMLEEEHEVQEDERASVAAFAGGIGPSRLSRRGAKPCCRATDSGI